MRKNLPKKNNPTDQTENPGGRFRRDFLLFFENGFASPLPDKDAKVSLRVRGGFHSSGFAALTH